MPVSRLPLAFDIQSRKADSTKDSYLMNALVETISESEINIVKRPGTTEQSIGVPITAGQGQGLFSWYERLIAIVGNTVYSLTGLAGSATKTSLGSLQGAALPVSFVETGSDNFLVFQNGSYIYTLDKATSTLTNQTNGNKLLTVSVTVPGGRYTTAPTVSTGGSGGETVVATFSTALDGNGQVGSITVLTPGTYASTPTLTLSAPPTGVQAVVQANFTNGGFGARYWLGSLTILTAGSGYVSAPAITIATSPYGDTATAILIITAGVVTGYTITNDGQYNAGTTTTTTVSAPPNQTAQANANMNSTISGPFAPGICYLDGYVYIMQSGVIKQTAVTVTGAGTATVTMPAHGLIANTPFTFSATTAVPTGTNTNTTYYVSSTNLTVDTFEFSLSAGGASVATTSTGTGVYVNTSTSSRIYGSNEEDPEHWNALNYISVKSDPDSGIAIAKHLNYIVAFGQWSTEFFYNEGNPSPGSPLGVNQSAKLEIGCANGYSVANAEQTLIWVGNSLTNGRSVYMLSGISPIKVSNKYIDKYLNSAPMTAANSVHAYCLKIAGHTLYILTLTERNKTLVYDLDEKKWCFFTDTNGNYFKLINYTGFTEYSSPTLFLQGDTDGKIYRMNTEVYDDAGVSINFRARSPITDSGSTLRKFYRRVEVVGDKITGTLYIRHSDDDYVTWNTARGVSLSLTRPILWRNGTSRRRAWEVYCTDNVPIRLRALEIEFDIGEMGGGNEG